MDRVIEDGCAELYCNACKEVRNPEHSVYYCKDCSHAVDIQCVMAEHPLFLSYWPKSWKCSKCNEDSIPGFKYHCYKCSYTLDLKCASLAHISPFSLESTETNITTRNHFLHQEHQLISADLTTPFVGCNKNTCSACQLPFSGNDSRAYCCIECLFFLHESCLHMKPVMENLSFHPHSLVAQFETSVECAVCKIKFRGISYCCNHNTCNFYVHLTCASLKLPAIRHKCHKEHNLFYFMISAKKQSFPCDVCYFNCNGSFYRCVICDINFHFECIPLPQTVLKYKGHRHGPLTFVDRLVEDGAEEFYCANCEEPRNPERSIYYCEVCPHEADIHCVMGEEGKTLEVGSYMVSKFKHFSSGHSLVLLKGEAEGLLCSGCDRKIISSPAYGCRDCPFCLHESCVNLPTEISHRFHKQHQLYLSYRAKSWRCYNCNKSSPPGFRYQCHSCFYALDLKCALTNVPPSSPESMTPFSHFLHKEHQLILKDFSTSQDRLTCSSCRLPFLEDSSLAYGCVECEFFLHRFCSDIEETIDNKYFHPAHHLRALNTNSFVNCAACKTKFKGVSYCCNTCNFHLHVKCAELQLPALKHKCHQEHFLYYFVNSNQNKYFTCDVCYFNCEGSFYRCVICDINFHFECIPLPKTVLEYKHHRHGPLTLRDEVGADAEKYCSSCKELRNPEHSVYYCEDCSHAADIQCVMAEEGKTLKVESYMVSKHENAKLEHFSHQHRLASDVREALGRYCNGCDKIILGPAYGCKDCQFYLHKSCTELPFEISHPFHQQHSLFLSYWPKTWKCDKCSDQSTHGFKYSCYKCHPAITLDLKCAYEIIPIAEKQVVDTSQEIVVDELVKIISNLRAELRQREQS
ncbi:hypothetical protein SLEP1_g44998 [Rubroshorea leprosula]|uniref:Phorbol-ester/DAG-type domain-containing protein n=1 Tax=Rubroshorea leprosula TaxID=152421 RepID=A0AAV5LIF0_9ROSI|nr:hypothetical protein SLEP1_g44998 [Rubroshorea leprosula]